MSTAEPPEQQLWQPQPVGLVRQSYIVSPTPGNRRLYSDQPSAQLLWRLIERHSEIKELATGRFNGTTAERDGLWAALRGLVIQAHEYFNAAEKTKGPSAALLYYYCFLNLAKAEILLWRPERLFSPSTGAVERIKHGLSHDPSRASTFETDELRVHDNEVFTLLFEKRVGEAPKFSALQVVDLLRYVPELATDLQDVRRLPTSGTGLLTHAVATFAVGDLSQLRALGCMRLPTGMPERSTAQYILKEHRAVAVTQPDASQIFGKRGHYAAWAVFFASEGAERTTPTIWVHEADAFAELTFGRLRQILDIDARTGEYGIVAPSLEADTFIPLLPSLASYALMYYVSSLVRYKPYQLYSESNGLERWLLNAYVEQAPTRLLMAALNGISGEHHLFSQSQS